MALSVKQRADLLALARGGPSAPVSVPTQIEPQPKPVAVTVGVATPKVPNSVMVALREAAAERSLPSPVPGLPPGIRPEFAHKPMARQRPGFAPALPPIREGEYRVDIALWERQQAVARELARDEWVRSRGHDPYARMHTSMRGDD
jgi:hypothetical protein